MERYISDELMRPSNGVNSDCVAKRKKRVEMTSTCPRIWKSSI